MSGPNDPNAPVSQADLDEIFGGSTAKKGGKYAGLTLAQLIDGFKAGRIPPNEFTDELKSQGYPDAAVKEILAQNPLYGPPSSAKSPPPADANESDAINYMNPKDWAAWLAKQNVDAAAKQVLQAKYDKNAADQAKADAKAGPPTADEIRQGLVNKQQTNKLTTQVQSQMEKEAELASIMGNSGGGAGASTSAGTGTQPPAATVPPATMPPAASTKPSVVDQVQAALKDQSLSQGELEASGMGGGKTGATMAPAPTTSGPPVTGDARKDAFIASVWPTAVQYSQKTGIPPQVFVAINGSESNWGAAGSLFGIKGTSPSGQGVNYDTHEVVNGKNVGENDQFATYANPAEGYDHFLGLISSGRYKPAWDEYQKSGDWQGLLKGINQAGYATDPNWASMIGSMTNQLGGASKPESAGIGGAFKDTLDKAQAAATSATQPKPPARDPNAPLPDGWRMTERGLERSVGDGNADAQWAGTEKKNYDRNTGQVSNEVVGWNNPIQGASMDPTKGYWGVDAAKNAATIQAKTKEPTDAAQMVERLRSLQGPDLVEAIRSLLGRDATTSDRLSPPGGTFVNGDPLQRENNAAIAKLGAGFAGHGYEDRVNPDNPYQPTTPIRMNNAPVMSQGQAQQTRLLGGFEGDKAGDTLASLTGVDESQLGGPGSDRAHAEAQAREGEMQTRADYGTDAVDPGVRQQFMSDMGTGYVGSLDDWYRRHGVKLHEDGGFDLSGMGSGDKQLDWQTRQQNPILLNQGMQGDRASYIPDYENGGFSQSRNNQWLQNGWPQETQPDWHLWASTPGNNAAPGIAGEDMARLHNHLIASTGRSAPPTQRYNGTYSGDYDPTLFEDGGIGSTGTMGDGTFDLEAIRRRLQQISASRANQPQAPKPLGELQGGSMPRGWTWESQFDPYNDGGQVHMGADGDGFTTAGPTAMVDMRTGKTKAIASEYGQPEDIITAPRDHVSSNPIVQQVQQILQGAGMGGQMQQAPQQSQGVPVQQLRQMAMMNRPKPRIRVALGV